LKPNFLVFMTDQQRGDTQPPFDRAYMPNLERLYQNGISFTNSYCNAPHCCPSRACFFSGLYPSEHGIWNNVNYTSAFTRGLYEDVRLFPEDMKEAGYELYFSGKWHVSAEQGPEDFGFEVLYNEMKYGKYEKYPNHPEVREWKSWEEVKRDTVDTVKTVEGQIVRPGYPPFIQYGINERPFRDEETIEAAEAKIAELDGDKPFLMYVGTLGPHDPYFVPQRFLDMYKIEDIRLPETFEDHMEDKPRLYQRTRSRFDQLSADEHRESLRRYLAFCTYQDYLFGRLIEGLEKKGLLENTYVIYLSDHGDYAGDHGLWAKGLPAFKGAYHICSAIGFGGIKDVHRAENALVSLTDWPCTILDLAGTAPKNPMTGSSLRPFIENRQPEAWRDTFFTQSNGNEIYGIQRIVFDNRWKYVYNTFDFDELYDLENDPNEMKNLAGDPQYLPVIQDMCEKMWKFAHDHQDANIDRYIMTGLAPFGPGIIFDERS